MEYVVKTNQFESLDNTIQDEVSTDPIIRLSVETESNRVSQKASEIDYLKDRDECFRAPGGSHYLQPKADCWE